MVQLKGGNGFIKQMCEDISIPYGSIKSVDWKQPAEGKFKFQFLMVQLKVSIENNQPKVNLNFNSLWFN